MNHAIDPVRFGHADRELFGLLTPAHAPGADAPGAVLCPPLGQEAIRTHRLFRVLGDRLAASGLTVFRFDYFGTGDSGGEDTQGELDGWVGDTLAACDYLHRRSGCADLSLFGMRLGANIALRAAARMALPPRRVLLWDPIEDGSRYLQEMRHAHTSALARSFGARWNLDARLREQQLATQSNEFLGHGLNPALTLDLEALKLADDLDALGPPPPALDIWRASASPTSPRVPMRLHPMEIDIEWMTDQALDTPIAPLAMIRSILGAIAGHSA